MEKQIDLLEGSIAKAITRLAIPIMGTSLLQMAYNLTDMIWIGKIGSNAVAAVGAAGMYLWLASGLATIPRIGGQVKVGQLLGAGDEKRAAAYAKGAIQMGIVLGVLFGAISLLFHRELIAFFQLNHDEVIREAQIYLIITGGGILFNFLNMIFTGILTAMGNSAVTFRANTIGLVGNMVLDPVMIFGVGPCPSMGVAGAAIATLAAQVLVFGVYLRVIMRETLVFSRIKLWTLADREALADMAKLGIPAAAQNMLFSSISMVIARLIAGWGDAAVAVQKVGSQIESISWMTADGFASAVNTFTAQNYGAKKKERIRQGYHTAMRIMVLWGLFTSAALILFPQFFFRIFIQEPEVLGMGVDYLRILGVSQVFMCMEITSSGAFQGMGKTFPPAIEGVLLNLLRIPMALVLSETVLGLNGVWWSVSISSILKGLVLSAWFIATLRRYLKTEY
ncbi:MAG: MATE family efflux transporter [Lachnospiraceae bacterium]|nr:MATE family efflux transporter [Robinsoniella sp.]MDY3765352.1 MATE family efflux transporter [Lachnospiraceae bacterium]